jgi:hypothetical protein
MAETLRFAQGDIFEISSRHQAIGDSSPPLAAENDISHRTRRLAFPLFL